MKIVSIYIALLLGQNLFAEGPELQFLKGHGEQVAGLSLSADGKLAISLGTSSPLAIVWDLESKKPIGSVMTYEQVEGLRFGKDSSTVYAISGLKLGKFDRFSAKLQKELAFEPNLGGIKSFDYAPSQGLFLIGFYTGQYMLVDEKSMSAGPLQLRPSESGSGDMRLGFSPSGKLFYFYKDGALEIINSTSKKVLSEIVPDGGNVTAIKFSPDEAIIALGQGGYFMAPPGGDEVFGLRLYDTKTGALVHDLIESDSQSPSGGSKGVLDIAFANKGTEIAVLTHEPMLRIFDAKTYKPLENRRLERLFSKMILLNDTVNFLALAFDNTEPLSTSPYLSSATRKSRFEPLVDPSPQENLRARFSSDNKRLAFFDTQKIIFFDFDKSIQAKIIPFTGKKLLDLAFNPRGKSLYLIAEQGIWEFDPEKLTTPTSPKPEDLDYLGLSINEVARLASPDKKYLTEIYQGSYASGSSGFVLGDLTLKKRYFGSRSEIRFATFSPDSKWLATSNFEFNLYELPQGKNIKQFKELEGGGEIIATAFSPDSKRLVVARESEGPIKLLDLQSTSVLSSFAPVPGKAMALAMDNEKLWVATRDGSLFLLSTKTGSLLASMRIEGNDWLAWTSEGYFVGTKDMISKRLYLVENNKARGLNANEQKKFNPDEVLKVFSTKKER